MINPKSIRVRIGDLLDVCQSCTKKPDNVVKPHTKTICGGCSVYQELRSLGEQLDNYKKSKSKEEEIVAEKLKLSIAEYFALKNQGLKDKEIAEKLGFSNQQLANWKYVRKDKLKTAEATAKQKEVDGPPYAHASAVKREQVPVPLDREEDYKKLEEKHLSLVKRYEELQHVHAACADVEEELEQAKNEIARLQSERYDLSYEIEDRKKRSENLLNLAERFERENKLLKELLKLCL